MEVGGKGSWICLIRVRDAWMLTCDGTRDSITTKAECETHIEGGRRESDGGKTTLGHPQLILSRFQDSARNLSPEDSGTGKARSKRTAV